MTSFVNKTLCWIEDLENLLKKGVQHRKRKRALKDKALDFSSPGDRGLRIPDAVHIKVVKPKTTTRTRTDLQPVEGGRVQTQLLPFSLQQWLAPTATAAAALQTILNSIPQRRKLSGPQGRTKRQLQVSECESRFIASSSQIRALPVVGLRLSSSDFR